MKIIYFDLLGGISGDMLLAAFLDAGLPFRRLKKELSKLKIEGYALKKSLVYRGHTKAVKFTVLEKDTTIRTFPEIIKIIEKSKLSKGIKDSAKAIYATLALAESRIHRQKHSEVTFEELGKIDSLVDIVGAAIALDYLKAKRYLVSTVPVSKRVAPATLELLQGLKIQPVDFDYETITPTGAAILKTLKAESVRTTQVTFTLEKSGLGAGAYNPAYISNILKVFLGSAEAEYEEDQIVIAQTNIDDMNPQVFGYLEEALFKAGALDVYVQPVQMKKSRPGFLLTVLTAPTSLNKVFGIIFRETTSYGIRYFTAHRKKIYRQIKTLKTGIGKCRVKIGTLNSTVKTLSPEYEDCKRLAKKTGLALRTVYDRIKNEGMRRWHFQV